MKIFLFLSGIVSSAVAFVLGILFTFILLGKTVKPETMKQVTADIKAYNEATKAARETDLNASILRHPAYGTSTFPYGTK